MSGAGNLTRRLRYRALLIYGRLKPVLPNRMRLILIRIVDLFDAVRRAAWRRRHGGPPIPPASLRRRVGSPSLEMHLEIGRSCAADLERLLERAGRPLRPGDRVLDWGCGSGRVALELLERRKLDLRGCDVDADAIGWLRRAVPDGEERFRVSGFSPPLPYEEGSFDVLYGVSVVSHLSARDQQAWLPELARLIAPGGLAILTIQGPYALAHPFWDGMPKATAERLAPQLDRLDELGGFIFVSYAEELVSKPDKWAGIGGDYGLTFQTDAWTREHWGKVFEVKEVLPKAVGAYQDAVIATPR
jgi:SAM-dependent methyltransferase